MDILRLSIICIVYVFGSCQGLPEDWPIRSVSDAKDPRPHKVFTGAGPYNRFNKLLDLQEVKIVDNEWAVITARNFIYVLDLKSIEKQQSDLEYSQVVQWLPENSTTCAYKASHPSKCNNFVRVNARMSDNFFLFCGTNALNPKCREYKWNGTQFTGFLDGGRYTDIHKCPLDDEPSLAYMYSEGNLYTATRIDYRRDPSIRRTPVNGKTPAADFGDSIRSSSGSAVTREEPLPHIATDNNDQSLLNQPEFISAIETPDKIYIFFREIAVEQFGNGEMVYSRVAQVCKNDRGGSKNFRSHKWTSYFKARLNCSSPGKQPFYFNELRSVTRSVVINGEEIVFAIMTTPENSILGSAVCAYTVSAIEKAMNGHFMKRTSHDTTSVCWSKQGQSPSFNDPHPSACPGEDVDTRTMTNENLKFRQNHPLMKSSIQPITDVPLFTRTQARYLFTAIGSEVNIAQDSQGRSVTLLYIGTSDGHLLKVVPYPFDTDDRYDPTKKRENGAFVEELKVFDPSQCGLPTAKSLGVATPSAVPARDNVVEEDNLERVLSVTAVEDRDVILVAFRHCVISVPKQLCTKYSCKKKCVQSGNPYCGWLEDSCVAVTSENKDRIEQDLFATRTDLPGCPEEKDGSVADSSSTTSIESNQCTSATSFAIPLAISMSGCFIVVLVVFFVVMKCRNSGCAGCRGSAQRKSESPRNQSFTAGNPSWTAEENCTRAPIYKGPSSGSRERMSASLNSDRQPPFMGQPPNPSSYVGYNLEETSESATLDGDLVPQNVYASMNSMDSSFSRSTDPRSSGSGDFEENDRRKIHGVNIIEGVSASGRSSTARNDTDSNLNNNNTKKTVGIAYALSRTDTPVRRRSVSSIDREEIPSTPNTTRIRMDGSSPINQQWKVVNNPNFMTMSPRTTRNVSRCRSEDSEYDLNINKDVSRKTSKSPVTGAHQATQNPRMVTTYSNITNVQNRTFGRGSSVPNNGSEADAEPEYENIASYRPEPRANQTAGPPSPPPPNAKPGRKLSSFKSSHFNTSWFPSPLNKDGKCDNKTDNYMPIDVNSVSSSSGIMSTSSSSSGTNIQRENPSQSRNKNLTTSLGGKAIDSTQRIRLSDDGYGSGIMSNAEEARRISSDQQCSLSNTRNGSGVGMNTKVKTGAPKHSMHQENNSVFFDDTRQSSDDDCIVKELDEIQWGRESFKKDLKKKAGLSMDVGRKKKSSKRSKKNTDKRALVIELSSPSDSENVFKELVNKTDAAYGLTALEKGDYHHHYEQWNGKTLDDSFVDCKREGMDGNDANRPNQYAFYTMRPPGRMRQKLPRLRCGEKESDATLIAVPTPEIPKL